MSSILRALHNLVNHGLESPGDNVVLLVKVKLLDGTEEEEHVTVKEWQIKDVCDRFTSATDAVEVTVYRQFYHFTTKPPQTESADEDIADAGVLAAGVALGGLKI